MSSRERKTRKNLAKIAELLGVPVARFYAASEQDGSEPSAEELLELVTAFRQLRDPRARERVLDALRAELKQLGH